MNLIRRPFGGLLILAWLLAGGSISLPAQQNNDREALAVAQRQGNQFYRQGRVAEAIAAYEKGLILAGRVHGADALNTADLINSLASLYRDEGQYAKAEPLFLRSLRIRESKLGRGHIMVAISLTQLGSLWHAQGQYARAEPLYQRSLKIWVTQRGPDHLFVSENLNNLALLCHAQGQYAKAEKLYQRSLQIAEARVGRDHLFVARFLNNLGGLHLDQGRYAEGEPLFQRCLQIRESQLGKDHVDVARSLNNLAGLYLAARQYAKAEPLLKRSLTIWEKQRGPDHPDVAQSLNNLGWHYRALGQYAKAEPLFQRSLKILESKLGKDHPEVAAGLANLAAVYAATQRWQDAARIFDQSRRSERSHVYRVLPALAPEEQLRFLHKKANTDAFIALSLALVRPQETGLAERSAGWLVNCKAVTQQALAEPLLLARAGNQPNLRVLLGKLLDIRKNLARFTLASPPVGKEGEWQAKLETLTASEQQLSKELGQKSGHLLQKQPWVELADVRKALPANAMFIDIARFPVFNFRAKSTDSRWQPPRYVAWVIPPPNQGNVHLIDLGEAVKIEAAVAGLRARVHRPPSSASPDQARAERELAERLQNLARMVLQPLMPHIGKSERWIVSPDASLWLVPWAALPLPDGCYAVEKHSISYVISGRDLAAQQGEEVQPVKLKPGRPLVLADADFDFEPHLRENPGDYLSVRGLLSADKLPRFTRLPGTADEARAVAPLLARYAKHQPAILTGKAAQEATFKEARHPRVVVLSTHGFFLEDQWGFMPPLSLGLASRGLKLVDSDLPRPKGKTGRALENPLLRCGLALAGANQRDKAPEGADDGILTGLEIVGTDLRGTELVVLSACETGLGQVNVGEGVAGLRQAFQLAGARAVVATLWQIPDKETTALMTAFFENLAAKKGKAEALRLAQLQIIRKRRAKGKAAHPFYWAAFTLTGRGHG
jgi:CHAT domain-containing protein/tetratricopeptide (TPR) repeat protein